MYNNVEQWKSRCENLEEEKRELLVRLYRERELISKMKREGSKDDGLQGQVCPEKDASKTDLKAHSELKCKDTECQNCALLSQEVKALKDEIMELKHENSSMRTSLKYAENELSRLASSVHSCHTWYQEKCRSNSEDMLALQEQVKVCKEDFCKEREDRERAHGELTTLKEKLKEMEDIKQILTEQIEFHKSDYRIEKAQNEKLRVELHSKPDQIALPQLQLVYPLTENVPSYSDRSRRATWISAGAARARYQKPVESRPKLRSMSAPPSSFYFGGDVVVD